MAKSHEKAVWQEKEKSTKTEGWEQCLAGGQEYPIESTLKETRLEKIWTF